jgi:acyl-CoA thioester hydrolase
MRTRRVAPFPDEVLMRLGEMKAAHAILPRPDDTGRAIAMRKKA